MVHSRKKIVDENGREHLLLMALCWDIDRVRWGGAPITTAHRCGAPLVPGTRFDHACAESRKPPRCRVQGRAGAAASRKRRDRFSRQRIGACGTNRSAGVRSSRDRAWRAQARSRVYLEQDARGGKIRTSNGLCSWRRCSLSLMSPSSAVGPVAVRSCFGGRGGIFSSFSKTAGEGGSVSSAICGPDELTHGESAGRSVVGDSDTAVSTAAGVTPE